MPSSFWDNVDGVEQILDVCTKYEIEQIGDRLHSKGYRIVKIPTREEVMTACLVSSELTLLEKIAISILRERLDHQSMPTDKKTELALEILKILFSNSIRPL
jgi:hypothetical protein